MNWKLNRKKDILEIGKEKDLIYGKISKAMAGKWYGVIKVNKEIVFDLFDDNKEKLFDELDEFLDELYLSACNLDNQKEERNECSRQSMGNSQRKESNV